MTMTDLTRVRESRGVHREEVEDTDEEEEEDEEVEDDNNDEVLHSVAKLSNFLYFSWHAITLLSFYKLTFLIVNFPSMTLPFRFST